MSRAQQSLMSHRRNNIVLGGVGVRVWCKDEEVERIKVFHHIFVSVPRTFGDYYSVMGCILNCSIGLTVCGCFFHKLKWAKYLYNFVIASF